MNVQSNVKSLFSKRGFLFYNSIYGPNPGFTDYGPNGCAMARNLTNIWWRTIVQQNQNVTGYEGSTFIGRDVMRAWPEHRRVLSTTQGVVDTTDVAIETVLSKKDLPDDKLRELLKDKLSILHLRPSAIHSVLGNFHSIISAASPKLPFGVAQTGTCFVPGRVDSEQSEQKTNTTHSPAASEETHLDLTIFLPGHSREASVAWTNAFADSRLCWWQSLLINTPSRVTLNKTEKATTVTYESPSTGERLVLETVELLDDNVLEAHRQALKGKAKFMILNQKGIALEKPHVLHTHSSIAHCVNALALDALGDRADEDAPMVFHPCVSPVQLSVWDRTPEGQSNTQPRYKASPDTQTTTVQLRDRVADLTLKGYVVKLFPSDAFADADTFLRLQARVGVAVCVIRDGEDSYRYHGNERIPIPNIDLNEILRLAEEHFVTHRRAVTRVDCGMGE